MESIESGAARFAGVKPMSVFEQDDFVDILDSCFDVVLNQFDCRVRVE